MESPVKKTKSKRYDTDTSLVKRKAFDNVDINVNGIYVVCSLITSFLGLHPKKTKSELDGQGSVNMGVSFFTIALIDVVRLETYYQTEEIEFYQDISYKETFENQMYVL